MIYYTQTLAVKWHTHPSLQGGAQTRHPRAHWAAVAAAGLHLPLQSWGRETSAASADSAPAHRYNIIRITHTIGVYTHRVYTIILNSSVNDWSWGFTFVWSE